MNHPPHVPVPPVDYNQNPGGDWHDDANYLPPYQDDGDARPKKNKKDKTDKPVEKEFAGYSLMLAPAKAGEKKSWQRVGRRALPFDQNKCVQPILLFSTTADFRVRLLAMIKEHRQKTRTGPAHDLALLTSSQQGVINRLIMERKADEKNPNADWVLADVQRFGQWHWTSLEVKKIQVILKRHDINLTKSKDKTLYSDLGGFQSYEIIDLAVPVKDPKKKDKKVKNIDDFNFDDPPPGLQEPYPDNGQYHDQQYHDRQQQDRQQGHEGQQGQYDHYDQGPQPLPQQCHDPLSGAGQPMGPPPGAIPIDPHQDQMHAGNPFQPYPDYIPPPNQYNPNPPNNATYPVPLQHTTARAPPERRPSTRRRSSSATRLRAALDRERADNADLQAALENIDLNQRHSDHSSRYSDPHSVFSYYSAGDAYSPPSTPPRSDFFPRERLHHRRSSELREARYGPKRYRDEDVQLRPAYRPRSRSRRRSPVDERREERPRRSIRPILHHTSTYDDYPRGQGVMYLPAHAPRSQRRITEGGQGSLPNAAYAEDHRRRREERRRSGAGDYERSQPVYERRKRSERLSGDDRVEYDRYR